MIGYFLAGYLGVGLGLALLCLAIGRWVDGGAVLMGIERADGTKRSRADVLLGLALTVVIWPLPAVLLFLASLRGGDDPPEPPAMGRA